MTLARISRGLAAPFKPPYQGLAALVWLYFVLSFAFHPNSAILSGVFVDLDDYMHLVQVLDWLKGQSWFDVVQRRIDPPRGAFLHFSRLAELPLAGLIAPLRWAGLSWISAATLAAAIWPPVLLAALLATLIGQARRLLPRDKAELTAFLTLFATPLLFHYMPGRVDHHGLALLLTALAYGCAMRMMEAPDKPVWSLGAGFFLALGLSVALEVLPWLLLLAALTGLWMAVKGGATARAGLLFALSLHLAGVGFLVVTRPPSAWLAPTILSYSVVYVLLTGGIALCGAGVALAALTRSAALRATTGLALTLVTGGLFLSQFPELIVGPYGALDQSFFKIINGAIIEMQPLGKIASPMAHILFPFTGLFACAGLAPRRATREGWPLWLLMFAPLAAAISLMLFYQARFSSYAALFSVLPIAAALARAMAWAPTRWRGRKLFAVQIVLLLLAGPLPSVLLPAVQDGRSFNKGVLLFPMQAMPDECVSLGLTTILNYYGSPEDPPRLIMNSMNEGAPLLFRTRHSVVATPYHTDVKGFMDSHRFFATTDPAEAEKIVRAHGADLVAMCRILPAIYRAPGLKSAALDENGKLESGASATFAEQLTSGKVPAWLRQVKFPLLGNSLLFEVRPSEEAAPAEPGGKPPYP
ncbi:MAG: hypothetical protein HGA90_01460 [Alphaproteobacteria bacterium]|nr:hypothetical protein [Alphaproteobacteria bacterium]